jgi:two-component system, response regulator RegA
MVPGVEPLVVVATANPGGVREVGALLREWGCRVAAASDGAQLATTIAVEAPALLLLDPALQADGVDRLLTESNGFPVALVADREPSRVAEAAVRSGAFDYLTWPLDPHRLRVILAHAVERYRLLERIRRLEGSAASPAADGTDGHLRAIDRMEKGAIVDALRRTGGNVREAARLLGFGQATVYRKVKRYKIALPGRGRLPDAGPEFTPRPPDFARSYG